MGKGLKTILAVAAKSRCAMGGRRITSRARRRRRGGRFRDPHPYGQFGHGWNKRAVQGGRSSPSIVVAVFDTSVLLGLILDRLELGPDASFSICDVSHVLGVERRLITEDVQAEIFHKVEDKAGQKFDAGIAAGIPAGLEERDGYVQRKKRDAEVILAAEYELVSNEECWDYRPHYREIMKQMNHMVENPRSEQADDWIRLKRMVLKTERGIAWGPERDLPDDKRKEALGYLVSCARGNDVRIIAKAMKISEGKRVRFVSDDADHAVLAKWAEKRTGGFMTVWRPKEENERMIREEKRRAYERECRAWVERYYCTHDGNCGCRDIPYGDDEEGGVLCSEIAKACQNLELPSLERVASDLRTCGRSYGHVHARDTEDAGRYASKVEGLIRERRSGRTDAAWQPN